MRPSRPFTKNGVLQLAAWATGAFALIVFTHVSSLDSKPGGFNGAKLMNALATYSDDIKARGEKLPESVTLDDLIRLKLLRRWLNEVTPPVNSTVPCLL